MIPLSPFMRQPSFLEIDWIVYGCADAGIGTSAEAGKRWRVADVPLVDLGQRLAVVVGDRVKLDVAACVRRFPIDQSVSLPVESLRRPELREDHDLGPAESQRETLGLTELPMARFAVSDLWSLEVPLVGTDR